EPLPQIDNLVWGALAGLSGAIGLIAFYRALATGRMGIAAPLAAVLTALVPVIVGIFTQGLPGPLQLIGFVLALVGVWLLSRPQGNSRIEGIELAMIGGMGFGGFLVLINR